MTLCLNRSERFMTPKLTPPLPPPVLPSFSTNNVNCIKEILSTQMVVALKLDESSISVKDFVFQTSCNVEDGS